MQIHSLSTGGPDRKHNVKESSSEREANWQVQKEKVRGSGSPPASEEKVHRDILHSSSAVSLACIHFAWVLYRATGNTRLLFKDTVLIPNLLVLQIFLKVAEDTEVDAETPGNT